MQTKYTLNGTEITQEQAQARLDNYPLTTDCEIVGDTVAMTTLNTKMSKFEGSNYGSYRAGSF